MENLPLVSVVIPIYNRENYLAAALDSVFAQTYRPIEVIAVDDGSTDRSGDIVRSYPEVRYFYQSNQGVSVARNTGIAAAQGEFIAFLDADDLWKPDKLSIQIAYMLAHPNLSFTGTKALNFLEPDTQVPPWFDPDRDLGDPRVIIPSTLVVRQSAFDRIGNFAPAYRATEDIEWLWRAKDAKLESLTLPVELTLRRFHGTNLSWEMASTEKARLFKIVRESIARQSLKDLKFSIISNDCWGGAVYQYFGIQYQTPFIGTRIMGQCYLKLLKNLRGYLESPLEFSSCSRYESVNLELKERYFPIGVLKGDVEIHFYHEADSDKAASNWNRRLERIHWDRLFVKFSDFFQEDFSKSLQDFESLDFDRKICFTSKQYAGFPSAFFVPSFQKDAYKKFFDANQYFDVMAWLKKKHGSDLQDYRIQSD
ncbi:hypothetical protein C7B77_07490 [Chamaesiphon polymorphus CCALA 037]|uniref:Glycosyltransferase 2-like domain-containing protein n=1 Tax=Chamaesiphon polymorphus CCALA 037 TaxID=2107692 RepID=A0A2T1GIY2_9CYAN|nr:hypothetical protein C7B77_07490 [Chamaesiphon polymorphus CCALA 037]